MEIIIFHVRMHVWNHNDNDITMQSWPLHLRMIKEADKDFKYNYLPNTSETPAPKILCNKSLNGIVKAAECTS